MRRIGFGLLLVLVLLAPVSFAAQSPSEVVDYQYPPEKNLAVSHYGERDSLILPERPLAFEAEIAYQASVEDKRSVDNPAFLRFTVLAPGGGTREEVALRPGDRKNGVIRLLPGHQLRVEMFAGQYTFLLIKSGADIKCKIKWPEFRFIQREQTRHYGFYFSAAGWAQVDRWTWDFGDGSRGQGPEVEHVYRGTGSYRLQVLGYQGSTPIQSYQRTMVVPEFIEINPQVSPLEGATELTVSCRSGLLSHYGEQAECLWDFGDGTPPVPGDQVQYVYKRSGRYQITLTARHLTSNFTVRRTWTITVRPISIQNKAQVTPLEGPIPLRIEGLAQPRIDGSPVDLAYRWDFGDGNLSEQPKTYHVFGEPGQYQVTLYLSDRNHPDVLVQPASFTVRALPPSITLSPVANPVQGNAPLTVLFSPGVAVKGYPVDLRYRWDFGDGSSAEEATPLHTYGNYGEYDVRLTVKDARYGTEVQGRLRISVAANANVGSALTVTATAEPQSGRAPLNVIFRAQATPGPTAAGYLSYEWTFGDGSRASGQTVAHTYQHTGQFAVTLIVRDTRPGRTDYAQANLVVTAY